MFVYILIKVISLYILLKVAAVRRLSSGAGHSPPIAACNNVGLFPICLLQKTIMQGPVTTLVWQLVLLHLPPKYRRHFGLYK